MDWKNIKRILTALPGDLSPEEKKTAGKVFSLFSVIIFILILATPFLTGNFEFGLLSILISAFSLSIIFFLLQIVFEKGFFIILQIFFLFFFTIAIFWIFFNDRSFGTIEWISLLGWVIYLVGFVYRSIKGLKTANKKDNIS